MDKKKVDQIIGIIFHDSYEESDVEMDFIPEVFQDCVEKPLFGLEDVNEVLYVLSKAGLFQPQDEKGNWWTTPLYWKVYEEYHSLENRIEKDKDQGEGK